MQVGYATLAVGIDGKPLDKDIKNLMLTMQRFGVTGSKAISGMQAPLGSLSGAADQFSRSMDAANARVVAFGSSAGVINMVRKAFDGLVESTMTVEKSLKELQVISGESTASLSQYSKGLFTIAKNTAMTFGDAAKAATEFSRQGLSMNEILKRTNDTMIMMRLTGIGLDEAISGLTATINAFSNEKLSSKEILNALSNIDLAAAASTDGIIQGMARSASAARAAGVSFRELASFIGTLQEKTGLQGGVLGNSAKSIFTRLGDPKKLGLLSDYGIKIHSDNGELLKTMDILKNIAQFVQGSGGLKAFGDRSELVAFMKELSGLYQIDKLQALMNDLGKSVKDLNDATKDGLLSAGIKTDQDYIRQTSDVLADLKKKISEEEAKGRDAGALRNYQDEIENLTAYDRNLKNANLTTDEAYKRNEMMNQTLDYQANRMSALGTEFSKLFSDLGSLQNATSLLTTINNTIEWINENLQDGDWNLIKGALSGITDVISGPGFAMAITAMTVGIAKTVTFTKDVVQSFLQMNSAAGKQAQLEAHLAAVRQNLTREILKDSTILDHVVAGRLSEEAALVGILSLQKGVTKELSLQDQIVGSMTAKAMQAYQSPAALQALLSTAKAKAPSVPNKASGEKDAVQREIQAIKKGVGGASSSASPVVLNNFPLNGKKQTIVANTDEYIVGSGNNQFIVNKYQYKELLQAENFAKPRYSKGVLSKATQEIQVKLSEAELKIEQEVMKGLDKIKADLFRDIDDFTNGIPYVQKGNTARRQNISSVSSGYTSGKFVAPVSSGYTGGVDTSPAATEKEAKALKDVDEARKREMETVNTQTKGIKDNTSRLIAWSIGLNLLTGTLGSAMDKTEGWGKAFNAAMQGVERYMTVAIASNMLGFKMGKGMGTDIKQSWGNTIANITSIPSNAKSAYSGEVNRRTAITGPQRWSPQSSLTQGLALTKGVTATFSSLKTVGMGLGAAFKSLLGPIGLVWTAFDVLSTLFPEATDKMLKSIGQFIMVVDSDSEAMHKEQQKVINAFAENVATTGKIESQDIKQMMDEVVATARRAQSSDKDLKDYKTDIEWQQATIKEILSGTKGGKEDGESTSFNEKLAWDSAKIIAQNSLNTLGLGRGLDVSEAQYESIVKAIKEGNTEKAALGMANIAETRATRIGTDSKMFKDEYYGKKLVEDEYKKLLNRVEGFNTIETASSKGRTAAAYKMTIDSNAYRNFTNINYKTEEDRKKELQAEVQKNRDILQQQEMELVADLIKNNKELGELEKKGGEDYQRFLYNIREAINSGDMSILSDYKISDDIIKEIQAVSRKFSTDIEDALLNMANALEESKIKDLLPSPDDISLIIANISGSTADKIKVQNEVLRQTMDRAWRDAQAEARDAAGNIFKDLFATGLKGENALGESRESILGKIQTANVSQLPEILSKSFTSAGTGMSMLNPEDQKKLNDAIRKITLNLEKVGVERLSQAVKNAEETFAKVRNDLNKAALQDAINKFTNTITALDRKLAEISFSEEMTNFRLDARAIMNPAESSAIEVEKANNAYATAIQKVGVNLEKFYADLEKETISKISSVDSLEQRQGLMSSYEKIQQSGGFRENPMSMAKLMDDIERAQFEDQKAARDAEIKASMQLFEAAKLLSDASYVLLENQLNEKRKIDESNNSNIKNFLNGPKNFTTEFLKNIGINENSIPKLNANDYTLTEEQKKARALANETYNKYQELNNKMLEENEKQQLPSSTAGQTGLSSVATQTEGAIKALALAINDSLKSMYDSTSKFVNWILNTRIEKFSAGVKKATEALEILGLEGQRRRLLAQPSLDAAVSPVDKAIQEQKLLIEEYNDVLKENALSTKKALDENMMNLYQQIQKIEDPAERGEAARRLEAGDPNIERLIATLLVNQEQQRLGPEQVFSNSVKDFSDAVQMFTGIDKKVVDSINMLPSGAGVSLAASDKAITKDGKVDIARINAAIEAAGKAKNINPDLLKVISRFETGNYTNRGFREQNNIAGIMDPKTKWKKQQTFATVEESAMAQAGIVDRLLKEGGLKALYKAYAPVGAANDINGTNGHWVPNVSGGFLKTTGKPLTNETARLSGGVIGSNAVGAQQPNAELKSVDEKIADAMQNAPKSLVDIKQAMITNNDLAKTSLQNDNRAIEKSNAIEDVIKQINLNLDKQAATAATAVDRLEAMRQANINTAEKRALDAAGEGASKEQKEAIAKFYNEQRQFKTMREGYDNALAEMMDGARRLDENYGRLIIDIKDGFKEAFMAGITGADSFGSAMEKVLTNLSNKIIDMELDTLLSQFMGSFMSSGASGAKIKGMAAGGPVMGGSGSKDDVPAMLMGGEYVLNKNAVKSIGKGNLDQINNSKGSTAKSFISALLNGQGIFGFSDGGYVDPKDRAFNNGGLYENTSRPNTGAEGFFSPGQYEYGSIVGAENLRGFAFQSFTSGKNDISTTSPEGATTLAMETESWRLSQLARAADNEENRVNWEDKQNAFNMSNQELEERWRLEQERKAQKKALRKGLLTAAALFGANYLTGGFGAGQSWGLANVTGGTETSFGRNVIGFQSMFGNNNYSDSLLKLGGDIRDKSGNILKAGSHGLDASGAFQNDLTSWIRNRYNKQKAGGGLIAGDSGARDTNTVSAMSGEYIVNKNAVKNVGTPFLDAINKNMVKFGSDSAAAGGNGVIDLTPVLDRMDEMLDVMQSGEGSGTQAGNLTVNFTTYENGEQKEEQQGGGNEQQRQLVERIRQIVMETIVEQKRPGGQLSPSALGV